MPNIPINIELLFGAQLCAALAIILATEGIWRRTNLTAAGLLLVGAPWLFVSKGSQYELIAAGPFFVGAFMVSFSMVAAVCQRLLGASKG
jgi:hypothetical protein